MEIENERLDSWKEIADYLQRDVRTVQRWEDCEQLPVHRILHKKRSSVYAFKQELDVWIGEKEPILSGNGESWAQSLKRRLTELPSLMVVAAILLVAGATLGAILYRTGEDPVVKENSHNVVPLTSYEGREDGATLSPAGDQVVFSWNRGDSEKFDLYLEQIETRSRIQLTNTLEREYSPAWSNDGSLIAYLRASSQDRSEVMLIPSLGGDARKFGEISTPETFLGRQLSWSPGGDWLVTSDREDGYMSRLVVISPSTRQRKILTEPPNGYRGDHSAAFSRDGRSIVFVRSLGEWMSDLFMLKLSKDMEPQGEPKRLTFLKKFCVDPIWLANDEKVLFAAGTWPEMRFYELEMDTLALSEFIHFIGEGVSSASYSATGRRLVFTRSRPDINIWRLALSGGENGNNLPAPLIVSSGTDWRPQYSRTGNQILYSSQRTGAEELWVYDNATEGTGQVTKFYGTHCGSASWSPDDQRVAFHSCRNDSCNIFVKDAKICMSKGTECDETPCCLRQITSSEYDDFYPSWSRDGKWIYFASGRSGKIEVWKVAVDGGQPTRITKSGGLYAIEGEDGASLYFSKMGVPGIWKQNLKDGSEELVVRDAFHNFALVGNRLYFIEHASLFDRRFKIRYLDLDTGENRILTEIARQFAWSFSVAPDASDVVWAQFDNDPADVMMVENY